MKHSPFAALAAALAVAGLAACSTTGGMSASTSTMGTSSAMGASGSSALAPMDRDFAIAATGAGLYEVEASRLALSHASDPRVRSYAQMLIEHHTTANNELLALLRARGFVPPMDLPADLRTKYTALSQRSGADFDRMFVQVTGVQDHQATIDKFQAAMPSVTDPGLKAWATKTMPTLQMHLAQAQQLASAAG